MHTIPQVFIQLYFSFIKTFTRRHTTALNRMMKVEMFLLNPNAIHPFRGWGLKLQICFWKPLPFTPLGDGAKTANALPLTHH
jgi:hypothetical protein